MINKSTLLLIRSLTIRIPFILLFLVFLLSPRFAFAEIRQLTTDTTSYSLDPHIDGNNVVWQTITASGSSNLYLYDIASQPASQFTDNTTYNSNPKIDSGKVVWIASDSATKINTYDIATGETKTIADSLTNLVGLDIEAGYAVWGATNAEGKYAIFLYNINTDTLKQLSDIATDLSPPQINGGKVLWEGFDFFGYNLYVYDIASDTTKAVNLDIKNYSDFRLNLGTITGFDLDNNIHVYNIASQSATKIETGTSDNAQAQFHTSNGVSYVFWGGYDGEDYHIYAYFMANGVKTQMTINNYNNLGRGTTLRVNGERVMWDTPDGTIRVYDNTIRTVVNLSEDSGYFPEFNNDGTVVWTGDSDTNSQIYYWDGTIPAGHAPIITPISNQVTREGENVSFSVSATTTDGDNAAITVASLPPGAVYDPDTQTISWTPQQGQAGTYAITITAKDDETPSEESILFVPIIVREPTLEDKTLFLGKAIIDFHIDTDIEANYLTSQQLIYTYLQNHQNNLAINQANRLIREIDNDYAMLKISRQAHDELLQIAQSLN